MAENEGNKSNAPEKSGSAEDYDPALDFYSEQFDPLKALNAANIKIPVQDAPVYDNIAKFDSVQRGLSTEQKPKKAPVMKFERKFLPHQMPVRRERVFRKRKNLKTQMEQFEGPLALLKKCVDERIRIKVFTRNAWGIRGYCLAFVVAFDKHWNMALEDVNEVWTRKKKTKIPALDSLRISHNQDDHREASTSTSNTNTSTSTERIKPPRIYITKVTSKLEYCERCVPQLVIRGEQVAFINLMQ